MTKEKSSEPAFVEDIDAMLEEFIDAQGPLLELMDPKIKVSAAFMLSVSCFIARSLHEYLADMGATVDDRTDIMRTMVQAIPQATSIGHMLAFGDTSKEAVALVHVECSRALLRAAVEFSFVRASTISLDVMDSTAVH